MQFYTDSDRNCETESMCGSDFDNDTQSIISFAGTFNDELIKKIDKPSSSFENLNTEQSQSTAAKIDGKSISV